MPPRNNHDSASIACPQFQALANTGRRQFLQAGAAGVLGLGLPQLWRAQAASAATNALGAASGAGFGKAKACIFIFAWGGPSQLDTFDPKPAAPDNVRGPFQPIATSTPGVQISEHFQRIAKLTDKLAIIRSLAHDDPAHLSSVHATLTGHWAPVVRSDATPPSRNDTPHIGSVLTQLRPPTSSMPPFVTMPWIAYHPAAPGGEAPGQHGGWLGPKYDPLLLTGDPNAADWKAPVLALREGLTTRRMEHRSNLLQAIDQQRAALDATAAAQTMDGLHEKAVALLSSTEVRQAFDLTREKDEVRDRYGRHIHGQCVLLARRLVEHGVPVVCINWHNDNQAFWDTHGNNFNRLKNDLIPPADTALSALLEDLQQRGMFDETIVAWVGEFGRRPEITANNSGREHWPYCYSGLLAGAGVSGGAIYGASDKHAAYPQSNPVSPLDYAATIYHALGVDAGAVLHDRDGRPHKIYNGKPLTALFA